MDDPSKIILNRPQPEIFTEYPFFRYGMTLKEFQDEEQYWLEFFAYGGKREDYKTLWKQAQESAEDAHTDEQVHGDGPSV